MPALTPAGALDEFGQMIREARDARGWSQKELADNAGIAQSVISALELGNREDGRFKVILDLARVLKLDPEVLAAAAVRRAKQHGTPSVADAIAPHATAPVDTDLVPAKPDSVRGAA